MIRSCFLGALVGLLGLCPPAAAQSAAVVAAAVVAVAVAAVAAEGTQFRLTLSDGRVLRSPELQGAVLTLATAERDPDATSGDVWLHRMLVEQADGSLSDLCNAGPDGRRQGFALASRMHPDGRTETTAPEVFDLVCTGGARAKCVRFGYRPWVEGGAALYNAFVRMVRADYCGDGAGTTRDGMSIDLYDDQGVQTADMAPDQAFEAGWTAEGAVCVSHVRVKENTSLAALGRGCPRLAGRLGAACSEGAARGLGAVIFNRSYR